MGRNFKVAHALLRAVSRLVSTPVFTTFRYTL
jgi:hypothetical protein